MDRSEIAVDPLESVHKGFALGARHTCECLSARLVTHGPNLIEERFAPRGEKEAVRTPVRGVGPPFEDSVCLHSVHNSHDRVRFALCEVGKLRLADASVGTNAKQDLALRKRQRNSAGMEFKPKYITSTDVCQEESEVYDVGIHELLLSAGRRKKLPPSCRVVTEGHSADSPYARAVVTLLSARLR